MSRLNQATALDLRAWMAGRAGDLQTERSCLKELIALEPTNGRAMERLADLVAQSGELELLDELRNRKAAIDRERFNYKQMINRPELAPLAAQLARAGEAIGRRFDARTWWRLAVQQDRSLEAEATAAEARLVKAEPPPLTGDGTIADLLASPAARTLVADAGRGDSNMPSFVDDAEERGLAFIFDNGRSELRSSPRR